MRQGQIGVHFESREKTNSWRLLDSNWTLISHFWPSLLNWTYYRWNSSSILSSCSGVKIVLHHKVSKYQIQCLVIRWIALIAAWIVMIIIISCTGTWFSLTSGGFCSPPFADPLQIICLFIFAKMKTKIKKKVKALHYPHRACPQSENFKASGIFYWETLRKPSSSMCIIG